MPPPAAFIDIASVPFSRTVTQAEFNAGTFGNVANEVWFRYIASAPIVLGMQTNSGGTFVPRTRVFESDGSTAVDPLRTGTAGQWSTLASAGTYYIQIIRNGGGSSNFDFTSEFDTFPLDDVTLEPGDIIINDDQDRPGGVLSSDGTIKSFISTLPGGEMGAILPNGFSIWHDRYNRLSANKLAVLDASLQFVGGVDAGLSGGNFPIFTADATQFYLMNDAGELWTVSDAAVAANTGYVFGGTDPVRAIAANAAGSLMYWVSENDDGVIHTIDLGTLLDGADLYTVSGFTVGVDTMATTPNAHPGDMFVLDDGTIVTWWFESGALTYHLIHISAAGSLLHDITFVDPIQIDHLARIAGDSDGIFIWLYTTIGFDTGHFGRLDFDTEVISEDFTGPLFEDGVNMLDTAKFGISTSCTMLVFGAISSSPGGSPSSPGELPEGEIGPIAWVEEWEDGA